MSTPEGGTMAGPTGAQGKLVLAASGGQEQEFLLAKPRVSLGRAATNDIVLGDPRVSRLHAYIECGDSGCQLVDNESGNGTYLNGRRIERATLAPGDVIGLGGTTLRFQSAAPRRSGSLTMAEVPIFASEQEVTRLVGSESLVYTIPDTSVARLAVQLDDQTWEIPFESQAITIGRAETCDVVLERPQVSRVHARIERRDDGAWIVDAESRNGTWVDGQRVAERRLETGTEVRIGPARLVFKAAFGPRDLTVVGPPAEKALRLPVQRLPVVFIPGFMGSEMWSGQRRLWPNVHAALANPEIFSWPDKELEARTILHEHVIVPNFISLARYSRLVDYLEEELGYRRGEDLLEFAYDWRQDNRVSARALASAVREWRTAKGHQDIAIIAHSMGCLISRYYVECLGGSKHVKRLMLVGGLNNGSPKTFQAFLGARGVLAFNQIRARFQRVVAMFPSVYQSLPNYPCVMDASGGEIDIFTEDGWVPPERRPSLRDAVQFFAEIGRETSVPTVCVFGYGLKTPVRMVVQRNGDGGWLGTRLEVADRGDDTIPQESAVVQGADIHPVQQHHGVLYTDADVRMRLRLELVRA